MEYQGEGYGEKPAAYTVEHTNNMHYGGYTNNVAYDQEKMYAVTRADTTIQEGIETGLHRGLKTRHIAMIAIGGTIGTGLFLTSGSAIASAGPAGALLAYAIVGSIVYCVMTCLGELATFMPLSGFHHYGTLFIDPAVGFGLGWNYWLSWAITIAAELSAVATIIQFWNSTVPAVVWCVIFLIILTAINLIGVAMFGEVEYWFSLLKVVTCIMFIIVGILVSAGAVGGTTYGVQYWHDPGAFQNGAAGTISVLLGASYSFQGTELVGVSAGETRNPKKAVPKAIHNVIWRILLFYISSIFLEGLILPADDPNLSNVSDATTAAYTLVFVKAGLNGAANFINAVILTSALSAGNSGMYACSRVMLTLSREGYAPKFMGRTNRRGVPWVAVLIAATVGCLCMFAAMYGSTTVFFWLVNITGVIGFVSWCGIAIAHYRFRRGYVKQGYSVKDLPFRSFGYPFTDLWAATLITAIVLGQGWSTFSPFSVTSFFTSYIGILPFVLCCLGYKLWHWRTCRPVRYEEMDFTQGRVYADDPEDTVKGPWWRRVTSFVW